MRWIVALLSLSLLGACGGAEPDSSPGGSVCSGTWRAGPLLDDPREAAATVALPDGRVLVVGGHPVEPGWQLLDSAEIYDPAADAWTSTGALSSPRYGTPAALLANGKVLVPDGRVFDDSTPENDEIALPSELFDPATETWSITGSMGAYVNGGLVALPNGDALVAGGIDWLVDTPQASAQRYLTETGTWTDTAPLSGPRTGHRAIVVVGEVLVLGGSAVYPAAEADLLDTTEIYDPVSDAWRRGGAMKEARWAPGAALLLDGRVLVAGGGGANDLYAGPLGTAEIYDPSTGAWTPTGSMLEARSAFAMTVLHDGRVLVAGGWRSGDLASAEIYDPEAGTWSPAGTMSGHRRLHTAAMLQNGDVLVVGGYTYTQLRTTEIYTPCID